MRFLGIDYGSRRTGLALSDPLGVTCRPFGILTERDEEHLVSKILFTAKEQKVDALVVGLPRPLSGRSNSQVERVLSFAEHLRNDSQIPVRTWDERFTTSLARRSHARLETRDAVAACYMLQNYLDALSNTTEADEGHD